MAEVTSQPFASVSCAACGVTRPAPDAVTSSWPSIDAETPCAQCGGRMLLEGRYLLGDVLGRGALGTTHRALERSSGAIVAVKELPLRSIDGFKAIELFEREAATLRQLDHPCIPAFHESFTSGEGRASALYIVQELVEGRTLEEELAHHRFSERELLELIVGLATTLAYLHERQPPVVHRDLKPANVVVRDTASLDHRFVLLDFGSVTDVLSTKGAVGSTVAGTFGYMAPEQTRGRTVPASDLYGLGALALHVATRKEPHELLGAQDVLRVPKDLALSPGTRQLLERLLARESDRRPDAVETITEARRCLVALTRPAPPKGRSALGLVWVGLVAAVALGAQQWLARRAPPKEAVVAAVLAPVTPLDAGVVPVRRDVVRLGAPTAVITLPTVIEDVIPAGGDRYLLLWLPRLAKLAVFDVERRAITNYLALSTDRPLIAGGRSAFVVVDPAAKTIERWSLETFTVEATAKLAVADPRGLALGSHSEGPLVVLGAETNPLGGRTETLVELGTLRTIATERSETAHLAGPTLFRASPFGGQLATWENGGLGTRPITARGTSLALRGEWRAAAAGIRYVAISDDDARLHACDYDQRSLRGGIPRIRCTLPSRDASLFVSLLAEGDVPDAPLEIHEPDVDAPLVALERPSELAGTNLLELTRAMPELSMDERIQLFPRRRLVVTIPERSDSIIVRTLDLADELRRLERPHLFLRATPSPIAVHGEAYSAELDVASHPGPARASVIYGPTGLVVTPEGRVSWTVPRAHTVDDVKFTLQLENGPVVRQVTHTIHLRPARRAR